MVQNRKQRKGHPQVQKLDKMTKVFLKSVKQMVNPINSAEPMDCWNFLKMMYLLLDSL